MLLCVCYRGFFTSHLKAISFSPDNNFIVISSDTGTVHLFYIGKALVAKNNLATVRKTEVESILSFKMDQLLRDCNLAKQLTKQCSAMQICKKSLGNVSVPGASFYCGLSREARTQREQYIVQITSRWGVIFEIAFFNKVQMAASI